MYERSRSLLPRVKPKQNDLTRESIPCSSAFVRRSIRCKSLGRGFEATRKDGRLEFKSTERN